MKFIRITHDPSVMGGKPCIRGLRVTVLALTQASGLSVIQVRGQRALPEQMGPVVLAD